MDIITYMDLHYGSIIHILLDSDLDMAPCMHIIAHMDMDMAPCLYIIAHMISGYGSMAPCLSLYIYHLLHVGINLAIDSMDLDIITYMDLHMALCPHIICSHGSGYGSMAACLHIIAHMDMDMTPCPHICYFKFIIPY